MTCNGFPIRLGRRNQARLFQPAGSTLFAVGKWLPKRSPAGFIFHILSGYMTRMEFLSEQLRVGPICTS